MKKTFVLIILFFGSSILLSQSAGNTGLSFLKFGFGAKNIAMGDASTASVNDLSALFYNPARLTETSGSEVIFMHNEWIQDVRSEVVGVKSYLFGLPVALGLNVTSISDLEARTRPGDPESFFDANYFYGSLSTGFKVVENFSFGASIKYLYEGILSDEANGFGFDFGVNYRTDIEGLDLAASIRNIGSMNSLRVEETKLPTELRVGPAYTFSLPSAKLDITGSAEYQKYFDTDDNHFNVGAEVFYDNIIALRAGYQSGHESRDFTAGLGLRWGNLNFDYAFLPFTYGLGSANLFSLSFRF